MSYFCKLATTFRRLAAISCICFVCRISCEAMNCIQSYTLNVPRKGWAHLYLARSRALVSSMNAKVRTRTPRSSASISSFSRTASGSSGRGDLRRIRRASTSAIGRWNLFKSGNLFGSFWIALSALLITPRSTMIRCATSSPADHAPSLGFVFHCSVLTASATRKKAA